MSVRAKFKVESVTHDENRKPGHDPQSALNMA